MPKPKLNALDRAYEAYTEALLTGIETVAAEQVVYTELKKLASVFIYTILHRTDVDLAHDTAVDTIFKLSSFRGDSLFSTWAYTVEERAILMARRRERRVVELEEAETVEAPTGVDEAALVSELKDGMTDVEGMLFEGMLDDGGVARQIPAISEKTGLSRSEIYRISSQMKGKLRTRLEANYRGEASKQVRSRL